MAQNPEKEPLYFQTYTIENGLADNWIRDIAQDQQGFIWIATQSGLNRFNGYDVETFLNDPDDPASLSSDEIINVYVDRKNQVWVVTRQGIDRFNRANNNFERIKSLDPGSFDVLGLQFYNGTINESLDGSIWIGTFTGLERYNPEKSEFESVGEDPAAGDTLSSQQVTSIAESKDGRLWVGTNGGGINILDPESGNITRFEPVVEESERIPNENIFNLFIDDQQILWVNYDRRETVYMPFSENETAGTPSGLWQMDLKDGSAQLFRYDPDEGQPLWARVSQFIQTSDGSTWFSSSGGLPGGLRKFKGKGLGFDVYYYDPSDPGTLPWNFATSLLEGISGHLWVATSRGLGRADRRQLKISSFSPLPEDKFDLVNNFYGIEEVDENVFWISNDVRQHSIWNRNTNSFKLMEVISARLPVINAGENHVFNLQNNTIARIDKRTFSEREYVIGNQEEVAGISYFLKVSDELLLISTTNGLWKLNPKTGSSSKVDLQLPFTREKYPEISYMAMGSQGSVWLLINGTILDESGNSKGILIGLYDPLDNTFEPVIIDDTYRKMMTEGTASHLMYDSSGDIWVSKGNELVHYQADIGQAWLYDESDGIKYRILGTLEDDNGMIWIGTEYGILRLDPETGLTTAFGQEEGIRPFRINEYSFYKRDNGELMFGGVGGLSYFNPNDIQEVQGPPLIQLISLETNERNQYLTAGTDKTEPLPVDWSANSVSLEYVSVNFRNPEETTYQYILDGLHDTWVNAGTRRFAQFSNLSPGRYTFQVKAIDANGQESVEPATISFRVFPPWYRTWWAYGFYALLFIGGIVMADRLQRRRVQQKEREKAREKELEQAKEIEKAYENLKAAQDQLVQQEKLASLGQLTAGIAHEIKNPLNFVNNFSDLSTEMIEELIEAMKNGDLNEAEELANDISKNLKKIQEHGSRADGIVSSMLQHSRGGSGEKKPTSLNSLIKEYVNLAFHGMRAGKEPINVDIDLQLDENVGKVPLIAEDFSRAILNLTNNAFDAMREKEKLTGDGGPETGKKSLRQPAEGGDPSADGEQGDDAELNYSPKLSIRTKSDQGKITIEIEDNGPGIPEDIKDNILQPFFTTKKGTQGTGLGLSITNDIIKAHGGELKIETNEGAGSTFIIQLPLSTGEL